MSVPLVKMSWGQAWCRVQTFLAAFRMVSFFNHILQDPLVAHKSEQCPWLCAFKRHLFAIKDKHQSQRFVDIRKASDRNCSLLNSGVTVWSRTICSMDSVVQNCCKLCDTLSALCSCLVLCSILSPLNSKAVCQMPACWGSMYHWRRRCLGMQTQVSWGLSLTVWYSINPSIQREVKHFRSFSYTRHQPFRSEVSRGDKARHMRCSSQMFSVVDIGWRSKTCSVALCRSGNYHPSTRHLILPCLPLCPLQLWQAIRLPMRNSTSQEMPQLCKGSLSLDSIAG